ncbi:MAG: hypothetical protein WBH21_16555 [Vibrio anguillarum]
MRVNAQIDWLQFRVKVSSEFFTLNTNEFKIVKQDYSTRHFREVYIIYVGTEELFTLACRPYSHILKRDQGLLKVANKFLYQNELIEYLKEKINVLNLDILGISRIDICNDFNKFNLNICPHTFIQKFVSNKYLKYNKCQFEVRGKQSLTNVFNSLRFGSKMSDINYYLYNKTEEMNDKTFKPWIYDRWQKLGLNTEQNVWRLEFSLKANQSTLISLDSGEAISLNNPEILTTDNLNSLYHSLLRKYFVFVKNNNKSRKDRMKKVSLVKNVPTQSVLQNLSEKRESNRSDKIFIKKLFETNNEIRGLDFELSLYGNDFLKDYIASRMLEKWAEAKIPEIVSLQVSPNFKRAQNFEKSNYKKSPEKNKKIDYKLLDIRYQQSEMNKKINSEKK